MNTYSLDYIDDLYAQYVRDPQSVSETWRRYFEQFVVSFDTIDEAAGDFSETGPVGSNGQKNGQSTSVSTSVPAVNSGQANTQLAFIQDRVDQLVREYRVRGHLIAQLDPLGLARPACPELNPEVYGLTNTDLERVLEASSIEALGTDPAMVGKKIGDVLRRLRNTYCRSIGAQFMHIDNRNIRDWLQRRMEMSENRLQLALEVQRRIYTRLADASIFEEFVRRKFVGAKTFSLEGAESLIPLLDLALEKACQHKVRGVVLGMAHRGRLNVLANIMKKRAMKIFWSFDDPNPELNRGRGDVRYHLGYSSDWTTASGENLHLSLCFNPSHLEFVNTVALGRCRSKQDHYGDLKREQVMTILIHGDAAFAGEGIVQETLNLSQLQGYRTGGTLHVVINNQVGFTTEPHQGRSTTYATDIAKMLQIPIFHVNGEDPEAVAQVVSLAMDFRKEFGRDVVIDLHGYRRWGHNEGDEPRFTQPQLYAEIDRRKSVRDSYLARLLELGQMTQEEASLIQKERTEKLESEFEASHKEAFVPDEQSLGGVWQEYFGGPEPDHGYLETGVDGKRLCQLIDSLTRLPESFSAHKKLKRPMKQRRDMAEGKLPLDWACAEAAAFATLLSEGHPLRLSGQDCERGTFSHRHAVLHDPKTGETFTPLANLADVPTRVEIVNSPLSEAGVLGFEYGYSLDCPEGLTIWEAQFGDFWNVAQVIVDQFIASAEDKWGRLSGLVMFLPHGFEGQGPEHCSARLERFLMMSAEYNIQVCQPTTPSQLFHLLRRQIKRAWRKPLVVLTPKSLLRHPMVVSPLEEFVTGGFLKVLPETETAAEDARRILMCSGKVYYDLLELRQQYELHQVSIIRLEQLYPLRESELLAALDPYPDNCELFWVQEEPKNMGAWQYIKYHFGDALSSKFRLKCISRTESASPSTGSLRAHKLEQADLLEAAFEDLRR